MAAGAGAIALASVTSGEHVNWQDAARREAEKYGIGSDYVQAASTGEGAQADASRTWADWFLLILTSGIFLYLGSVARTPQIPFHWPALLLLSLTSLAVLAFAGISLFKTTRFR